MTSEVLILNKHAVVLGADSAVTTTPARDGEHPRYSKTANKLFELSDHGAVAVMIYGGAQIDCVPWEVAIKLFRASLGQAKFPTVDQYLEQLMAFLNGNAQLFSNDLLISLSDLRFDKAVKEVLRRAFLIDKQIFSCDVSMGERTTSWGNAATQLEKQFETAGVLGSLSSAAFENGKKELHRRVLETKSKLSSEPELSAVDADQLASLALLALYSIGNQFLPSTGLVVAGYGEQDIFPGYRKVEVYGHIGSELLYCDEERFHVTHTDSSMIKGWAQTSMIDVFTDGFGFPLWKIINDRSREGLYGFADELRKQGLDVPQDMLDRAVYASHEKFMKAWTAENYQENWQPLRSVLASLGVEEMAHLTETLLTLQAVKERVTSSSESVGGPIDVAAISKAEGMVWLKRKHFFDAELNMRYVSRLRQRLES